MIISVSGFTQKIVFRDEYNTKNISMPTTTSVSAGGAEIVEDSVTKERLLIYSGKKELIFYMLDAKWKLIEKWSKDFGKETQLDDEGFEILRSTHDKTKWTFTVKTSDGFSDESIDFATKSHTAGKKYTEDLSKNYKSEVVAEAGGNYVLGLDNGGYVTLTSFAGSSKKTIKIDLSTELPLEKSKKYTTEELYNWSQSLDSITITSPYFTRKKVHFYVLPDKYVSLVFNEEPVAELSYYDKTTGKTIKRQQFSVEALLPANAKGKKINTAALFHDNKVHVMATSKSGGVYAVMDADSKQNLYTYAYSEKDEINKFNYGPVTYETLPGVANTGVLREKLDDISLEKFCEELYKHSCAITLKKMKGDKLLVTLANYDQKVLAAPTSTLRSGMNTMTSPDWYISTSAGIVFEQGGWKPSAKKTTWNEVNKANVSGKYERVQPDDNAEYNQKGSIIMARQTIDQKQYVIYYSDRELKIAEKALK